MIDKTSLLETYSHLAHLTNRLFAAQQGRGGNLPALYHPEFTVEQATQIHPYTVETSLGSIPYTEAYHTILEEVITTFQTLIHHHDTLCDPIGVRFFNACIEASQSNDRDILETIRLNCYGNANPTTVYCPSRGPIETYNDLHRHRKKIFECSLMTIDRTTTSFIQSAIDTHVPDFVHNTSYFSKANEAATLPPKITTLVGDLTLMGGDFVQIQPSGRSRPTDPEILMKAGSIKQIFLNQLQTKTSTHFIPLTQKLFQTDNHVVLDLLHTMPRLHVVLHEHGHTIGKLPDYPTRAGRRYTMIEEIRADFVAIALSLYLEKNNHLQP